MFDTLNSFPAVAIDVIERLRDDEIRASVEQMKHRDRTTEALRAALKAGMSIDDLSAASGLPCAEIRRRVDAESMFGDLASLTSTR